MAKKKSKAAKKAKAKKQVKRVRRKGPSEKAQKLADMIGDNFRREHQDAIREIMGVMIDETLPKPKK